MNGNGSLIVDPSDQAARVGHVRRCNVSNLLTGVCHCFEEAVSVAQLNKSTASSKQWHTTRRGIVMNGVEDRLLGTREAAKIIYATDEPTTSQVRQVYHDILKEYFQALILRRRTRHTTRRFRRTVLAGQVGVLLVFVAAVAGSVKPILSTLPPERVAIQQWLGEHAPGYKVTKWYPPAPDGEGVRVRVQYRYRTRQGKGIHTDRLFMIEDSRVTRVDSEW